MIDKNKIFQLFVDGQEVDDNTRGEIKTFMEGPYAKIGMFVKLIQNHHVFHLKLEKFLKKESPDYNIESTKTASEFTIYSRAWSYIEKVDIEEQEHFDAILNFDPDVLHTVLEGAIRYFEEMEHFLKCAHLFNIQNILKEQYFQSLFEGS
jgi:hypothetical protein